MQSQRYSTTAPPASPSTSTGEQAALPAVEYPEQRAASFVLKDQVVEQVVKQGESQFVVRHRDGTLTTACDLIGDSPPTMFAPLRPDEIEWSGVRLPSRPESYGSVEGLDARILAHVQRYVALPREIEPIVPLFVRYTWLCDRGRTSPYLRLSGPTGSGKSRAMRVIGNLCCKPYFTNASTTPAAMFRSMGKIGKHTLCLDENEHDSYSEMQREITKILKVGFEKGGAVQRCVEVTREGRKTQEVERHRVFGPKIIAAIEHVPDKALHSRCILVQMSRSRAAVVELPASYEAEVGALQNQLLQYRLDHFFEPLPEPRRLDVDGRLMQLYLPLARVARPALLPSLDALILEMQQAEDEDRLSSPDAVIARLIQVIASRPGCERVSLADVVRLAGASSAQEVGYFVKSIGLKTAREKGNRGPRYIDASASEVLKALADHDYIDEPAGEAA